MPTVFASSAAELSAALANATQDTTIELANGDYGELHIKNNDPSISITIKSVESDGGASFDFINLYHATNLTFENITVEHPVDDDTVNWTPVVTMRYSSDINFVRCEVSGGNATTGAPIDGGVETKVASGNVLGLPTTTAFQIFDSQDIAIVETEIHTAYKGVVGGQIDGLSIIDSEIHNIRTSPIAARHVDNLTVEGNHLHDSTPWNYGGPGDHGGFVRTWMEGDETGSNYVIRNNIMDVGDSSPMLLGIFLEDNGTTDDVGYENILIENNVILNNHIEAVHLENARDATIVNNTLLGKPGDGYESINRPLIMLTETAENVVVSNNVGGGTYLLENENNPSVDVSDNYWIDFEQGGTATSADAHFADPYSGDLEGFVVNPDSVIAESGLGSSLLSDAEALADFFSEGPVAESVEIAVASVSEAVLMDIGFSSDDVAADGVTYTDQVEFLRVGDVDAVRLNGGAVSYETGAEHFGNAEFAFYLDFMKENADDSGVLFSFLGPLAVKVGSYGLTVYLATDEGGKFVNVTNVDLAPGEWQRLGVTFDGETETFTIFMNGEEMFSTPAVPGDFQADDNGAPMIVGSTGSQSFTGLVGDITMLNFDAAPAEADAYLSSGDAPVDVGSPVWPVELNDWGSLVDDSSLVSITDEDDYEVIDFSQTAESNAAGNASINLIFGNDMGNTIKGGGGADEIIGGAGGDSLLGQIGDDRLDGGDDDDTLIGHDGDDILIGGAGQDRLYGGEGDDIYIVDNVADRVSEAGDGYDIVISNVEFSIGNRVEELRLTGTADLLARGNSGDNVLVGNDGANVILGGSGADVGFGGAGADTLIGHSGDDRLVGGAGNDRMDGGAGADVFVFNAGDGYDRIYKYESGVDRIDLSSFGFADAATAMAGLEATIHGAVLDLGGGDAIRFAGLDVTDLQATDFII